MLNPVRISLALGALVIFLGAYILFVDIPQTRQIEKHIQQERRILPFDDREVTRISWRSRTETIELERDNQFRWFIMTPIQSPADNREIRRILRALTIGKIKRIIDKENDQPEALSTFGLNPPYLTLKLSTPSKSTALALGDPGPFSPSLYVQTLEGHKVALTTLDPMSFAQKTLTDFRLKDLLLFDRERVQEIRIQNTYGEIVLQRVAGFHSLTPDWKFISPEPGPADNTSISTLLLDLGGLKATGFIDSETDKNHIRTQKVRIHAAVTLTEGSLTHHLDFFLYRDSDKAYAMRSRTDPIFEISPSILRPLIREPFYFQNKRLFGLEVRELSMVSVQTPQERYVLINQQEEWVLEENPALSLDQNRVNLFISRLVDLPAEINLPTEESEKGDLQPHLAVIRGIDRHGKERGKLVLGNQEKGLVLAQGAGLKGLYQVRSTILDQIPSKASLRSSQE